MNPILLQSPFNKGDLVESKLNELYPEDEGRYYIVTGFELRDIDADGFVSYYRIICSDGSTEERFQPGELKLVEETQGL